MTWFAGARRRRRLDRGQATVELALSIPILVLLMLGITDFARAYYLNVEITGASRAGARAGIASDTTDIADFIRSEPNTGIPNSVAAWGNTGVGQAYDKCTLAPGTQACGDPNGCSPSSFIGGQVACFAIRSCQLAGGETGNCTAFGAWGSRPENAGAKPTGLEVRVVYRMSILTPLISQITGGTGSFFLTSHTLADEVYF